MCRIRARLWPLLLCLCLGLLTACSNRSANVSLDPAKTLEQLKSATTYSETLTGMEKDAACSYYGVDAAQVEKVAAMVGTGATAENIAVFQAKNHDAAATIGKQVKDFYAQQAEAYADYGPQEVPKLKSAIVEQKDAYVVCCVTADNGKAKKAVQDVLK